MAVGEIAPFAGYDLNEHQLEFFRERVDAAAVLEAVELYGPVTLEDVCDATGLPSSVASEQLDYLRAAEIVNAHQTAHRTFYEVPR